MVRRLTASFEPDVRAIDQLLGMWRGVGPRRGSYRTVVGAVRGATRVPIGWPDPVGDVTTVLVSRGMGPTHVVFSGGLGPLCYRFGDERAPSDGSPTRNPAAACQVVVVGGEGKWPGPSRPSTSWSGRSLSYID